jgi:hypothetical protein
MAVGVASSASGMGEDDHIENVHGYDKDDGNFVIGVVLKLTVRNDESLTFYNATEVQIHGPQNAEVEEVMKMSSRLQDYTALRHYYQKGERETLADLMP